MILPSNCQYLHWVMIMINKRKPSISLDRPVLYRIIVPGHLDESWTDWVDDITLTAETGRDGLAFTTLTVKVDQAALQGLLRRLYNLGVAIISVECLGVDL